MSRFGHSAVDCELQTPLECHAIAALGDALLATDCEPRLVSMVVVVVIEPMHLVNDLLKRMMSWVAGCPHTQGYMANSMK
jgi:hypothetical protein